MSIMKKTIVSLVFLLSFTILASAQRTMAGHAQMSGSGTFLFDSMGAGLSGGVYTLGGYWEGGAEVIFHQTGLSSGEVLPYVHSSAHGGFNQRIFSTTDRMVNLYVGGGAFFGLEEIDPNDTIPSSVVTDLEKESVIYGLYAKAEAEVFLTGHIAFAPFVRVPYNVSAQVYSVLYEAGVSLRYNF